MFAHLLCFGFGWHMLATVNSSRSSYSILSQVSRSLPLLHLKPVPLEPQRPAILLYRPARRFWCATRQRRLDLQRHLHVCAVEGRQVLDHLLHDLPGIERHHARVDLDRAVEAVILRLTCRWGRDLPRYIRGRRGNRYGSGTRWLQDRCSSALAYCLIGFG